MKYLAFVLILAVAAVLIFNWNEGTGVTRVATHFAILFLGAWIYIFSQLFRKH